MRGLSLFLLLLVTLFFALVGCGFSTPEEEYPPGLPHGEFTLPTDAPWFDDATKPGARFDFSAGAWVYEPNDPKDGDLAFYKTFLAGSGRTNVGLMDTQPESLNRSQTAPTSGYEESADGSGNDVIVPVYSSHVYWIRTGEGHYAKIKIAASEMNAQGTGYDRLVVKWVYQPDGSTDFKGKPVEENLQEGQDLGEKHGLDTSGGLNL